MLVSCRFSPHIPSRQVFIVTSLSFSSLPLDPAMQANLDSLGYLQMTPIQAASLPVILAGQDLIAKAKTGSGKTAAFAIGLLARLQVERFRIQKLVLCPTRELADQVAREIRRLARATHNIKVLTLCGGVAIGPQIGSLEHGAHIIVGTPGRILDHLRKQTLSLADVDQLVLDEADRMLDMGFADDVNTILAGCPAHRQTLLFSATYPDGIQKISARYQNNPVNVAVEEQHQPQQLVQHFYELPDNVSRSEAVLRVLGQFDPALTLVFSNTRQQCQALADDLNDQGISALALHGDLEQKDRDRVLVRFANRSCLVLIATDVAARGIDVKELDLVINSEPSHDPEVHVHRVGRTGRAGETGTAVTLFSAREAGRLNRLEDYLKAPVNTESLPEFSKAYRREADMVCINIDGGKKDKLRAGDILGALTRDAGIPGSDIGKIDIFDNAAYVAVAQASARTALQQFDKGKIKGRKFRARKLARF